MPFLMPMGFIGSPVDPVVPPTFSAAFVDSDFALDNIQSTYTFSGLNFGSADAARVLVAAIGYTATAVASTPIATLGGVTGTLVKSVSKVAPDGETITVGIWQALVPTGTSGTAVVTFDAAQRGCCVGLFRIVTGNQAAQFSGSTSNSSGSISLAATIPSSGAGVVICLFDATTALGDVTPSNYTEGFDVDIWTNGHVYVEGGLFTASATLQATPSTTSESGLIAYASWGP